MITKQELQKIAEYIKRLSVRDTQFKKLSAVDDTTEVPVVHDNENRLVYMAAIATYVINNIDLASMNLNVDGLNGTTLASILSWLYTVATTPRDGNGDQITAASILYNKNDDEDDPMTVAQALNTLFGDLDELNNKEWGSGLTDDQAELLQTLSSINFNSLVKGVADFRTYSSSFNRNWVQLYTAKAISDALEDFKVNQIGVEDNLESTSTGKALSANQGRILKAAVNLLISKLASLAFESGPPTSSELWQTSGMVQVTLINNTPAHVRITSDGANNSITIPAYTGGSAEITIWPVGNSFLRSLSYSIGNGAFVAVPIENKRVQKFTIFNITDDITVYVQGESSAPKEYGVILPTGTVMNYLTFDPAITSETTVLEGSDLKTTATVTGDAIPYIYESISIKEGSSANARTETFYFNNDNLACSIDFNNIDMPNTTDKLVFSVTTRSLSESYNVTGLELGQGYSWSNPDTELAPNSRYENEITARNGYILSSVTCNGTAVTVTNNRTALIVIDPVTSNVIISVTTVYTGGSGVKYNVLLAASSSNITLSPPGQVDRNGTYEGALTPDSGYGYPVEGFVSLVDELGEGLVQSPQTYDTLTYSASTGSIKITGICCDIYVKAIASTPVSTSTRRIALKLMNVVASDIVNSVTTGTDADFGYPLIFADSSQAFSVTLSGDDATMNGDVTVKIGGITRFKQRSAIEDDGVYSENGISFDSEDGTLTINSSVFAEYDGRINIIATARTGVVTLTANSAISGKTINNNTLTFTETEAGSGVYKASVSGLTSITQFSLFINDSHLVSVDFGGVPIVSASIPGSSSIYLFYQIFQGCTSLELISGMVIRDSITSLSSTFSGSTVLAKIDGLYSWDVSNVTRISNIFNGIAMNAFDLEDWETTSSLVSVGNLVGTRNTSVVVRLGNFDTSGIQAGQQLIFNGAAHLVKLSCIAVTPPSVNTTANCNILSAIASNGWLLDNTIYVPNTLVYDGDTSAWHGYEFIFENINNG